MSVAQTQPKAWPRGARIAFRLACCYFVLYALLCANVTIWQALPLYGARLELLAASPLYLAAQWVARHGLHITGPAATLHASGFRDRALDWIANALIAVVALIVAAVWSFADRRRTEYATAFTWLRWLLRLAIVASMFVYGGMKIAPVQIQAPSLGVLNQTVGSMSRMTLLWTLLGLSPTYEIICGVLEMTAGVLLLFRRTALAGALMALAVMANVLLFDVFFDIPVKLYAANLTLMILLVMAPDLPALWRFFFLQQPAAIRSAWRPTFRRGWQRYAAWALEIAIVLSIGIHWPMARHRQWAEQVAMTRNPSPWVGIWHITSANSPMQTAYGAELTDVIFEPNGSLTLRAADGSLWGGKVYRRDDLRLEIDLPPSPTRRFRIAAVDGEHMVLEGDGWMRLQRAPTPSRYWLYDAPYRWVNEYGEEY